MSKIFLKYFNIFILLLYYQVIIGQSCLKVISTDVNFRKTPEIGNNIISGIQGGSLVIVDITKQEFSNWTYISYNGQSGYVYSKYLVDISSNKNNINYSSSNSNNSVKYYTNSFGEKVQSPTYYNNTPEGATAICNDGTYSFSRNRRGTCSHHGGVRKWL